MTDERFSISRRKALASLGAIGAASAGAGLGTSAYFSDQETFQNNRLVAGELDLKVDWQEHYSDWSDDEDNDPDSDGDLDIQMSDPGAGYTAFPPGSMNHPNPGFQDGPLLWVAGEDVEQFMKNTATEAFPDIDNDALHDLTLDDEALNDDGEQFIYDACEDGADVPDDLDPKASGALRSDNADTYDDENQEPKPLIALDDVKPGDFGEVTFSFHLCDNPGYVWMNADNVNASENGVTEPEADDPDEDQIEGTGNPAPKEEGGTQDVELLDAVRTAWWYDPNGNNLVDGEGTVDVMVCLDRSGSLNASEYDSLESAANDLIQTLDSESDVAEVGGLVFGDVGETASDDDQVEVVSELTGSPSSPFFDFPAPNSGNNTPMPPALDIADQVLDDGGADEQVIVLLTDGGPNYLNQTYQDQGVTGLEAPRANNWSADDADQPYDNSDGPGGTITPGELDETELVANNIKTPSGDNTGAASRIVTVGIGDPQLVGGQSLDEFLQNRVASPGNHFSAADPNAVGDIVDNIVGAVAGIEQVFRYGTLGEDLQALSSGNGIPLDGDYSVDTDFAELTDSPDDDSRDCFDPSTDHYIGFSWWLPVDHGNEVQSDSVSFDLGFYTEQCRHNTGSGMNNENVDPDEIDA